MESRITIIVTCRETDTPDITLRSLMEQDYQNYELIVVRDEGKGANYARNKGFKKVDTKFVLFSDNDIVWRKDGITNLLEALKSRPDKSYAYGAYYLLNEDKIVCSEEFDASLLRERNYVSTMTLVRTKDFLGFDESITNFQDWDAWLTMLDADKEGINCGKIIFDTISIPRDMEDGEVHRLVNIVKRKHEVQSGSRK